MSDMKQIKSMLATATALGYSQALVDVVEEVEKVRKECGGDVSANHYVYILFDRLSRLNGNAYEVGRKFLPLSEVQTNGGLDG